MSDKNKKGSMQDQNISDVLDMLKRSYEEDNSNNMEQNIEKNQSNDDNGLLSEDELKEKLRAEFMKNDEGSDALDSLQDTSYVIDETFFEDVEETEIQEDNGVSKAVEVASVPFFVEDPLPLENIEGSAKVDIIEAIEEDTTDEYVTETVTEIVTEYYQETIGEEISADKYTEYEIPEKVIEENTEDTEAFEDFEDSVSIDQNEEFDDIDEFEVFEELEEYDEDVTFDELESIDDDSEAFTMTKIYLDDESDEPAEYDGITENSYSEEIDVIEDNTIVYRTISTAKLAALEEDDYDTDFENAETEEDADTDDDIYDEDIFDDGEYENSQSGLEIDSSDISLLMQFGCEDEVVDHLIKDDVQADIQENTADIDNNAEAEVKRSDITEKAVASYKKLLKEKRNALISEIYMAFFAAVLLLYEGLPIIGINFPGIMNREEYYISHLLLGLQIAVFCAIPCFKRLADGTKKLIALKPNGYSAALILSVCTLIYNIIALFSSKDSIPPTFHFVLVCTLLFIHTIDLNNITTDIKNFEFYYGKSIRHIVQSNNVTKAGAYDVDTRFTLFKSAGKHSTAEKMYAGGLDPKNNIYFPVEANSVSGFLNILKSKNRFNDFSILTLAFSVIGSFIPGIIALLQSEKLYIGMSVYLTSLFITMPTVFILLKHLPYEILVNKAQSDDYSFASEEALAELANTDVMIFKDMHLFKKASPTGINIALYDSTPKYVLLGCLNALYSQIGGPMAEAFAGGADKRFSHCSVIRVGKSGVQAIVGSNYSVLIGSEQFMARYGITFPKAGLAREEDKTFTLCVSINGRASARLAVKYVINDMFYMFADRLAEKNISCAIETFDPLVSTQMLSQLLPDERTPINIVHLNANDLKEREGDKKATILFEASGSEAGVLARTSRLNLAVALCSAKQIKKLKKLIMLVTMSASVTFGSILLLLAIFGAFGVINGVFVVAYWLLSIGISLGIIFNLQPSKKEFLFERYQSENNTNTK